MKFRSHKEKGAWCCRKERCATLSGITRDDPEDIFTTSMDRNFISLRVEDHTERCLVDSGASISCISQYLLRKVKPNAIIERPSILCGVGVCGEIHRVLGETVLELKFGQHIIQQKFRIFQTLHAKILLGLDFLSAHNVTTDFGSMTLTIPEITPSEDTEDFINLHSMTIRTFNDNSDPVGYAETISEVVVPPYSEAVVPIRINKFKQGTSVILEPIARLAENYGIAGGKVIDNVNRGTVLYRLLNPTNSTILLPSQTTIVKAELLQTQTVHELLETDPVHINSLSDSTTLDNSAKQKILDLGVNIDSNELSEQQKNQLLHFLAQNRDVFAKDLSELGQTDMHYHTIHTGNSKPVSAAPYRQTPQMRNELERQLDEMERNKIIQESTSPWHSPVVLVRKKGKNEWRFCVDFRSLNKITEPLSFRIPSLSDVFDTLADSQTEIYSTLDLRSGFWQVPLDPATKHKSAFITHKGVYEFNRLAFGMMNSPMTFQCLMAKVLKELNFKIALVYIDDILIFSKSFKEHLHHLQLVFSKLRQAKLKLNPGKCHFATRTVKYLGHIISKDGIRVNPENTEKVKNFQRPRNSKDVKSFLGMANYYRKFVKDYAHIAAPLNALLKKNQKFHWTPACEKSFGQLKEKLTSAPILAFPKLDKPFILTTDASEYANGYILSQIQNNREHVISYGGRALRGSELQWHITDKEALALVEGIQHYKHYLSNQEFTVYTDNVSVKYLQRIKDCQGRLGRWSLLLQGYNFKILHRAGSKNPADCLSRQHHENSHKEHSSDLAEHLYSVSANHENYNELTEVTLLYPGETVDNVLSALENVNNQPDVDLPDLAREQRKCHDFRDSIAYKQSGQVPQDPAIARRVVAESYNYEMENGILKHFYSKRCKKVPRDERLVKQIAVPKSLRDDILRSYHDCIAGGGHQGFERTYAALRNKYYWPSMYNDINQYVQTCEICQQTKRAYHSKPPPLQPQPTHDIFNRWHMDILSGLPTTKDKYKHILLVVDSYSKWCEAFPLRTQEATEVAAVLYREIITRYGSPRVLISDRGKNFMSNLVKALSELFNITRHLTSSYRPQTNGAVERMNSVIVQALRAYTKDQQDDWIDVLPGIMMAYRATPATQSTHYSPFFLLYGREMTLPIDTALIPKDHLAQDHRIFLSRILQNLERTRKIAAKNIAEAQQRYKEQYDKNSKEPDFRPAQRVWLYCTKVPVGKAPKLHRKWAGPYYITRIGPNHTYKLRNCATNKEVKSMINAQRLKPYYDPNNRPTNQPDDINDDEELDPEEIDIDNNDEEEIDNEPPQPKQQVPPKQPAVNNQRSTTQPQKQQAVNQPTGNNSQRGQNIPVIDNKPTCQKCKRGQCKPFREDEIDSVISSARGNGTLYYKLKFTDKTRKTDWYFPCQIPSQLIREFHAKRTMSGKRRKRPLQQNQHKFFNKEDSNSNVTRAEQKQPIRKDMKDSNINIISAAQEQPIRKDIQTQTSEDRVNGTGIQELEKPSLETKLLAIRQLSGKFYFFVKVGNKINWYPMTVQYDMASDFILKTSDAFKKRKQEMDIELLKHEQKYGKKRPFISYGATADDLHEIRFKEDGSAEYLISFKNPSIPPEWVSFQEVPNGLMHRLLGNLRYQYNEEIDIPQ